MCSPTHQPPNNPQHLIPTASFSLTHPPTSYTGKKGFVLMDTLSLGDFTRTSNNEVSNSISSDGQGIYVVTQREMCRVDFNPTTGRLGFKWR